jgi:hypothetical protein
MLHIKYLHALWQLNIINANPIKKNDEQREAKPAE